MAGPSHGNRAAGPPARSWGVHASWLRCRRCWRRSKSGRGQVVGIVGEPGMGKSRLLAEWRQSLAAHAVTYLEGHCWSYGSATPYLPMLDLLRAQCGITPDDRVGSMTAKVHGVLQGMGMTLTSGPRLSCACWRSRPELWSWRASARRR